MTFDTILIIGGGLIGSSIARAAKAYRQAQTILMSDNSEKVCETLVSLKIADEAEADASSFALRADLVVLAVPPGKMSDVAKAIIPNMKPNSILTDVGSVKTMVIEHIQPALCNDIHFVPGHPIAGTENSGPEAGFADLFQNRWMVLTPEDESTPQSQQVKAFWEGLGSQVIFMDAARHDLVLATTSHVPHLIAFTLVATALDMETVTNNEVVKFSAGGFRDYTRLAASDPVMWRDVFIHNKTSVLEVVDRFIEDLSALKRAIRWNDGEHLAEQFAKTRNIREKIVEAGQENPAPNFGRDEN